jgi:hypothetical protein
MIERLSWEVAMYHDEIQLLLNNLQGKTNALDPSQYTPEKAHQKLVKLTGEDFGLDAQAWAKWFKELENSPNRYRPINRNPTTAQTDIDG